MKDVLEQLTTEELCIKYAEVSKDLLKDFVHKETLISTYRIRKMILEILEERLSEEVEDQLRQVLK